MIKIEKFDNLELRQFQTREEMGAAAGMAVIEKMNELLEQKGEIRMIFAAAPSQNELLGYLVTHKTETDWSRVTAFHMDEYIGLQEGGEQLFATFLKRKLFNHLPFKKAHLIQSSDQGETDRYSGLLEEEKIDIVCLGIGENGHIAFNDPPVADFDDPYLVKVVALEDACRQQQVNDGCFPSLADVPETAITLTVPALLGADHLFCVVPGKTKREAVKKTLGDNVSERCPATILRTHRSCILFVDQDAYPD